MLTQADITPILFSAAALGLLIVAILAAYIPAGKLSEDAKDDESITDYGDGTCGFKVKGENEYWFDRAKYKALSGKPLVYRGTPIAVTSVQFSDFGTHRATVVRGRRVSVVDTPMKIATEDEINKARLRNHGRARP